MVPTDHTGHAAPDRDGSSADRAILVDRVRDEYTWQDQHYPNYTLALQALRREADRSVDVLAIFVETGELRQVYFEVTALFSGSETPLLDRLRRELE